MSLIEVQSVIKNYGGLRPIRIRQLRVEAGEVVAIGGPDQQAAAVFTDLLTGTTLPDSGEVRIDGRSTALLAGADDWIAFLDRFGLVNERVVLLDQLTLAQNLAIPHTLDIDPMSPETRQTVARMAAEVGIASAATRRSVVGEFAVDAVPRPSRSVAGARAGHSHRRTPEPGAAAW